MQLPLDVIVENREANVVVFQVGQKGRQLSRRYHDVQISAISSWFVPEVEAWTVCEVLQQVQLFLCGIEAQNLVSV
jgi:hypothetical protein